MKTAKGRILLGGAFIVIVFSLYMFIWLNGLSFQKSLSFTPQANITLIPGPQIPTPNLDLLTSITATATVDLMAPIDSAIQISSYVQIIGTDGSGLNIRNSPELNGTRNFIANESEVFLVIGGPVAQDDHDWWQLSTPYDQSRQGWAVEDYLHLITP